MASGKSIDVSGARGFTLLELMMTIAIFAILAAIAVPQFYKWTAGVKVRATAEGIQNDLRLAQGEAIRENLQVQFSLTNGVAIAAPVSIPAAAQNGSNWMVVMPTPLLTTDSARVLDMGVSNAGVTITGPATVTFSPYGRWIDPPSPVPASNSTVYTVTATGGRTLDIILNLGGGVRLCDPNNALATTPDGCS